MAIGILGKGAKIDAYLMTMHRHRKLRTKAKTLRESKEAKEDEGEHRPIPFVDWNQEIWIPSQIPVLSNRLIFKLMDDDAGLDETVGSILFGMKEIVSGPKVGEARWQNVYGSPELNRIVSLKGSSSMKR